MPMRGPSSSSSASISHSSGSIAPVSSTWRMLSLLPAPCSGMRETDASGLASPTYSMHALCKDRRKQDGASLGNAWPQGTTDQLEHACLVLTDRHKQDVAFLENARSHGATDHLQPVCLTKTQGTTGGRGSCGVHGVYRPKGMLDSL